VAEIDVVERRARDGDGRDGEAARLERLQDTRHGARAVLGAGVQRAAVEDDLAHAGDVLEGVADGAVAAAFAIELDVHGVAAQVGLEPLGRPLGDDLAAVDDGEAGARRSASSR
jgi:hypothetical protein